MKCAVSIDLDGIACYYRIHGLGPSPAELEHVILERALPRAAALFAQKNLHVIEIPIRLDEKRPPAINLVKRVPRVLQGMAKLTYVIRFGGKP